MMSSTRKKTTSIPSSKDILAERDKDTLTDIVKVNGELLRVAGKMQAWPSYMQHRSSTGKA